MKTWAWRMVHVLLAYIGFTVALSTTWELQERGNG